MSEMFAAIHAHKAAADPCEKCGCRWHGLPCEKTGCLCKTAFVDRYADEGNVA